MDPARWEKFQKVGESPQPPSEAQRIRDAFIEEDRRLLAHRSTAQDDGSDQRIRFGPAWREYLEDMEATRRLRPVSVTQRRSVARAYYLGSLAEDPVNGHPRWNWEDRDLRSISTKEIRRLLALEQKQRRLKNSRVNAIRNHLSAFFRWCKEERGWIEENPAREIERRKVEEHEVQFLTLEEQARLLQAVSQPWTKVLHGKGRREGSTWSVTVQPQRYLFTMLLLMFRTGIRRRVAETCRWEWIDLVGGTISLPPEHTKGERGWTFDLTDDLWDHLRVWRHTTWEKARWNEVEPPDEIHLFPNFAKARKTSWNKQLSECAQHIGLGHVNPHRAKSSFATTLAEDPENSEFDIMAACQHQKFDTTKRYLGVHRSRLRRTSQRLSARIKSVRLQADGSSISAEQDRLDRPPERSQ